MNLITLHKTISKRLQSGEEREKIYNELSAGVRAGEEKKVALSIAAVAEPMVAQKLRPHNRLIMILLVVIGTLSLYLSSSHGAISGIADIINALIPFIFIPFASIFYGPSYRYIAIWSLLELLQDSLLAAHAVTAPSPLQFFILAALFTLLAISWFIARKAFAHLTLLGVKRDDNGNYII